MDFSKKGGAATPICPLLGQEHTSLRCRMASMATPPTHRLSSFWLRNFPQLIGEQHVFIMEQSYGLLQRGRRCKTHPPYIPTVDRHYDLQLELPGVFLLVEVTHHLP